MLEQYFPILLFILVGVGIRLFLLTVGTLSRARPPRRGGNCLRTNAGSRLSRTRG